MCVLKQPLVCLSGSYWLQKDPDYVIKGVMCKNRPTCSCDTSTKKGGRMFPQCTIGFIWSNLQSSRLKKTERRSRFGCCIKFPLCSQDATETHYHLAWYKVVLRYSKFCCNTTHTFLIEFLNFPLCRESNQLLRSWYFHWRTDGRSPDQRGRLCTSQLGCKTST